MSFVILIIVIGFVIFVVLSENRSKANLVAHTRERTKIEAEKRNQQAEISRQRRQEIESERNEAFKAEWELLLQKSEEWKRLREAEVRKQSELLKTSAYLSQIDPIELENLCLIVFAKLGYEAKPTSRTSDNGADGFLKKDGKLTILQCKRYQGVIGEPTLRDLLGTMHHFGASSAIIVTTGRLTNSASKWIAGKPIRVIYRNELSELIKNNISESDLGGFSLLRNSLGERQFPSRC